MTDYPFGAQAPAKCEACGFAYHSDGRKMEICWAHGIDKWLCLGCYFKSADRQQAISSD